MLQERFQALLLLINVKILYLSHYFPPEMGAPAARASELACHWAEAGHQVTILTGFPNHPTGRVHADYRHKLCRLIACERFEQADVVRTWLLPFPNRKPYERILNYSSFCVSAAMSGMFLARPDAIIATSPQLLTGLSGWWLSRVKRVPFVFEVRDLWPESLAAVGLGDGKSLLNRSLQSVAGFLYRNSEHIVVVTPAFRDYLIEKWKLPASKISVVENGVETDLFRPSDGEQLRGELGIQDKFVVSYIGTMGMAHGLETLIEAAADCEKKLPEVLFLFVGEGAEKQRIRNLAECRGLRNVRFIGEQPRNKVPEYIAACDACIVSLKKDDLFKTVIPTKMLEFMSSGKPVILAVDGQARRILERAQAGIYVEPGNSAALAQAIAQLKANGVLRDVLGNNGRRHIAAHYSRQRTAYLYISVLEEILGMAARRRSAAA